MEAGLFIGERRHSKIADLRIFGDISNVLQKLERIKIVTENRKTDGWEYFQDDEDWRYEVRGDERVCSVCRGYAHNWVGNQIPVEFPDVKVWGIAHVKPGTHIYYPFLAWTDDPDSYGGCRCNLRWPDYLSVLRWRLFDEMVAII